MEKCHLNKWSIADFPAETPKTKFKLKVTFLGTGTSQGVPVIGSQDPVCLSENPKDKRLRTSIMVEHEDTKLVVDTGPDFRTQMLNANARKLDAVLFTHEHKDHTAGLDDIRPFYFQTKKPIEVYATERVQKSLQKSFDYMFEEAAYPGIARVNFHDIDAKTPFQIGAIPVQPILVYHYKLPVLGFRFRNFTYITDANRIEPKELEKIKGTETLVLNVLRREKHISHFNLEEAMELIDFLKPKKTYFTHISFQLGFHDEVEKELPPNVRLAYDGLTIDV